MKILVISYYYPPFNCIGAIRVSKTTKYLKKSGHEVKVLTCSQQLLPDDLKVEMSSDDIIYTPWININKPLQAAVGGEKRVVSSGYSVGSGKKARLMKWGGNLYKICINFPDGQIGWVPFACKAGRKLVKQWRPDVIFASGLPISSLLVARFLSSKTDIPWVGELRDLWVDNSYRFMPYWRNLIEKKLEKFIFRQAKGIVTVSEPLAGVLRKKYDLPVKVITNGFDEDDFVETRKIEQKEKNLIIAYTGMIYEGRQDPSPLFVAVRMLREKYDVRVKVRFFGRYLQVIRDLAIRFNVEESVEINEPVTYEKSLLIQFNADILLLILGYGEGERGVFTGKFFEYIRSRRPILAVGGSDNVAANLICQRKAGFVSDAPEAITDQLLMWHQEKEKSGAIPESPESVFAGFSRQEQAEELDSFLVECLHS